MNTITQVVTIDGPAGAGKSTIARRVARALGMAVLDSGAMYRAATWNAIHRNVDFTDREALAAATAAMNYECTERNGSQAVFVDGIDVSREIRTPEVTERIRFLDSVPGVRSHLVSLQRAWAAKQPTVAEGRDMGTVVFPDAKCKIFLDASLDARAQRRADQLAESGIDAENDKLRDQIAGRDASDMGRAISPLRPAPDAIRIDTTDMTIDQVEAAIVELARKRL